MGGQAGPSGDVIFAFEAFFGRLGQCYTGVFLARTRGKCMFGRFFLSEVFHYNLANYSHIMAEIVIRVHSKSGRSRISLPLDSTLQVLKNSVVHI